MTSTPNDQQHQKTPFIVVGAIAVVIAIFGVSALALQSGFWTFIGLLVALISASFLLLAAYRFFIMSWLKFAEMRVKQSEEQHQHERLMFELDRKYNPQPQIAAPQARPVIADKYTDPARDIALKLLGATIDSTDSKYGPASHQVMTQADARKIGIIPDDWSLAVRYLSLNYDVLTIDGKGVLTTHDKTISRIMADTAVMSLPGMTR